MISPIRVAHIALQLDTGGMERTLAEFARHADRAHVSLRFISLCGRGHIGREIESFGWQVTALDSQPGLRPSTMFRLARLFREERIEVVHTHNSKPLIYAGIAARLAGVKGIVHTRHGQRHGATPRQNVAFHMASLCADRIVCVSNNSAGLCASEGIHAGKISRIYNGIDLTRFRFSGPAANGPALYVGRLSPEKDVATLLYAAEKVIALHPSFRLQIAGNGVCAEALKELSRSLGLRENVEFLGETKDVPALMRRASMFVLPSLTEGMPLTVLEAMACGLPVVATRVGGTPEAVIDQVTGLLIPAGEPERLARAILRLLDEPEVGRRMGIAGRTRVEAHFESRRMVARYESLYAEILGRLQAMAA